MDTSREMESFLPVILENIWLLYPHPSFMQLCRVVTRTISVHQSEGQKGNPQADVKTMKCNINLELLTLGCLLM